MARHKTHDRSVDCIWTGRLSRVASISRCTRRLFAGRGGMTGPETFERVYALSLVRFISGGLQIRGERLLSSPRRARVMSSPGITAAGCLVA